jgi:ankyrin repeat protein
MASPTDDDRQELLLSCRYGDLEDVKQFVSNFGAAAVADTRDENGNTVLHMASANGHLGKHSFLYTQECH